MVQSLITAVTSEGNYLAILLKNDYFIFKCLNNFENWKDSHNIKYIQKVGTIIENCNFHRNSEIQHS